MSTSSTSRDLPDFSRLQVAVVGDLVADRYLETEPRSLSREAPVMVLRHKREYFQSGGAANVARNLRALGARTLCFGAVGRDASGRTLLELLEREGIDTSGVESVPGWVTPTKTRIVSAEPRRYPQQVLRIDREPAAPLGRDVGARVVERVRALAGELDAIVVSDYEYGLVDGALARTAAELAARDTVVVLDPRNELDAFAGITALTPNVGEIARFTGRSSDVLNDPAELALAAAEIAARIRTRWLLITRGNLGMALYGADCPPEGLFVAASGAGNVTDVSGAGDTAAAVFATSLAAGADPGRAMMLANAASGVVVMEHGTAVCPVSQLRSALQVAPPPVRVAPRSLV